RRMPASDSDSDSNTAKAFRRLRPLPMLLDAVLVRDSVHRSSYPSRTDRSCMSGNRPNLPGRIRRIQLHMHLNIEQPQLQSAHKLDRKLLDKRRYNPAQSIAGWLYRLDLLEF